MDININQQCTVKISDFGVKILNAHSHSYHKKYKVDDTFTSELWDIMHIFGSHLIHGGDLPFETDIDIKEDVYSEKIEKDSNTLVLEVRKHLESLETGHERTEFIADCMENYCSYCGDKNLPCYCCNDE